MLRRESSREVAAFISPGRKSGVSRKPWSQSRRDGTSYKVARSESIFRQSPIARFQSAMYM